MAIGGAALLLAAVLALMSIRTGGTSCGSAFGDSGGSDFASVLQTNSLRGAVACEEARQDRRTLVFGVGAVGLAMLGSGAVLTSRDRDAAATSKEPQRVG